MTRFRLYTDQAIDAKLAQHRKDLAAQLADTIERMLPLPCKHRNRSDLPSCAKCAERRTVQAAAKVVRETGGAS
jgi:hypothetical protein